MTNGTVHNSQDRLLFAVFLQVHPSIDAQDYCHSRMLHKFVQEVYHTSSVEQTSSTLAPLSSTFNSVLELASNALLHQLLIRPGTATQRRRLRQLIASIELARSPAHPAKIHIAVVIQSIKLLAKHRQARAIARTAASLSQHGFAVVGAEPGAECFEGVDVVSGAGGGSAAAVGVEVLVDVEDEVVGGAVDVGDVLEGVAGAVVDEVGGVRPVVAGEQDGVCWVVGAGLADGGHGCLDGLGPLGDVHVVLVGLAEYGKGTEWQSTHRLVHDPERDLRIALVLCGKLRPQRSELNVRWTTLTDDLAVPPGIVVDIDDTHLRSCLQAALDKSVVGGKVGRVQRAAEIAVEQILPTDWQAEDIQAIVVDKMLHLGDAVRPRIDSAGNSAVPRGIGAEIETSDVDASILNFGYSRTSCRDHGEDGGLHDVGIREREKSGTLAGE